MTRAQVTPTTTVIAMPAGPGPGEQISPRRAATRQRLLTAAAQMFAERGIHGATVEDICDAAGFTRGAFYSNFADKEELFFALLRQKETELLAQIDRVLQDDVADPGGDDVIERLVEKVLAVQPMDRTSHLVHAESVLHAIRDPQAARELTREADRFQRELGRLLEVGLARAGRRLSVAPADVVAVLVAAFDAGMQQMLLRESTDRPDPGLARRTLPVILRALSEPV